MSGPTKAIAAGNQMAFWGRVDSLGRFVGPSGSSSNGASEGARNVLGIKTANPGPIEPDTVNVTGDDTSLGSFLFPPNELPSWIMEVAAFDLDTQAKLQSTLVENIGDIKIGTLQPSSPDYPDICLIYQSNAKSKDAGSDGVKKWHGYIIPLATAVPLGRAEFAERAAASDRFKVTAQVASKKPWGVTILDAVLGTSGAPILPFHSDNPITMHYMIGNAALATVTLDYTPVSVSKIIIHQGNGQLLTATADYTVSGKVITLVAGALAAGTYLEILYEIQL